MCCWLLFITSPATVIITMHLECIFYIFWLQRKLRKAKYVICTSESIKICHVEIKKIFPTPLRRWSAQK